VFATVALFETGEHELRAHRAIANESAFAQRIVK
jgi:hypothetical protein